MTSIADAVNEVRRKCIKVYKADADRLTSDLNSVNDTVKDHIGRWPLELIQNCDDALAKRVLIRVTNDAIYIADTGGGLQPDAIKSLSGTHLPVKETGIGRKGLGFKAVYEITSTPAVFSFRR